MNDTNEGRPNPDGRAANDDHGEAIYPDRNARSDNGIELWYRLRTTTVRGEAVAVMDTRVPDDAPQLVREGLARRAIVNAGGTCPCGARFVMPNRAARREARRTGQVIEVTIEHENGCPATLHGWRVAP